MSHVFVAIDPSFARMGVAIKRPPLDGAIDNEAVKWYALTSGAAALDEANGIPAQSIQDMFFRANRVVTSLFTLFGTFSNRYPAGTLWNVIVEMPPTQGRYAAGMGILYGVLMSRFCGHVGVTSGLWHVDCCSPMAVKSILGSKKASKTDSVNLAQRIGKVYGLSWSVLPHDAAEAIIMLQILLARVSCLPVEMTNVLPLTKMAGLTLRRQL